MGDKSGQRNWRLVVQTHEVKDYRGHFDFPYYGNCYEEAIRCIFLRTIRENEWKKDRENKEGKWEQEDISNIYAFLGKRGTGKTTAMQEFSRILAKMNDPRELSWWMNRCLNEHELRQKVENTRFFFQVLDPIDASRLEAKEDLFELILAQIYKRYDDYCRQKDPFGRTKIGYEQKQVLEKFGKIFRSYHAIRLNSQEEELTDSVFARLYDMSSSTELKKDISSLLEEMLKEWGGQLGYQYLVIVIDDLDLNIKNGYSMLEQLHKYFWDYHIIIMLAVDYDQINLVSEMAVWKDLKECMGNSVKEIVPQKAKEISRDYIAKVLPLDNRIYMPDIKKLSSKIVVDEENRISIKKFLLQKIAHHMEIYFDGCGLKIHFFEPESMRELVSYNQFLDSLYDLTDDEEEGTDTADERVALYDKNHERFNCDITERLAKKLLSDRYKVIYDEVIKKDLERRAAYVYEMAKERIFRPERNLELPKDYCEEKYSYGEFLRCIYELGRVSDEDKALIKCFLASFTSEMAREAYVYRRGREGEERDRARNRLKKFIGKSFGSRWTGELIPGGVVGEKLGYDDNAELRMFKIAFPFNEEMRSLGDKEVSERANIVRDWIIKEKVIPTLESIAAFFKVKKTERIYSDVVGFQISIDTAGVDIPQMVVTGPNSTGIFDIMGFVEKMHDGEEYWGEMYRLYAEGILKAINKFIEGQQQGETDDLKLMLDKTIREQSIYRQQNGNGEAVFPFYDLDLAYNVIKRARRNAQNENTSCISYRESYKYIKKAYEFILSALREEEKFYEASCPYTQVFAGCPFIQAFMNPAEKLNSAFESVLGSMIEMILPVRKSITGPEPLEEGIISV